MAGYKRSSKQLAVDILNAAQTAHRFTVDNVDIVNVKYEEEGYYNTSATVIPRSGGGYQDKAEIRYDRINIGHIFMGVDVTLHPLNQNRLSNYLPLINDKYDLLLDIDDIEEVVIDNPQPPFYFDLKIKEGNPAFYGQLRVLVSNPAKSLKDILKDITLNGIGGYPGSSDKINGVLYSYCNQYNNLEDDIRELNLYETLNDNLVNKINYQDRNIWLNVPVKSKFNFFGSVVIYKGSSAYVPEGVIRKNEYNSIIIIKLNEEYCTGVEGYFVLYYNE